MLPNFVCVFIIFLLVSLCFIELHLLVQEARNSGQLLLRLRYCRFGCVLVRLQPKIIITMTICIGILVVDQLAESFSAAAFLVIF